MTTTCTVSRVRFVTEEMTPTELGEHDVHNRQGLLPNLNQKKISTACVGVIGVGGLGTKYLTNLARLGVGYMVFCDGDIVELSNLNRQDFFIEQKFKNKALSSAENLKRVCTAKTTLEAYTVSFQDVLTSYPDAFKDVKILVCLVDNEPTRLVSTSYGLKHDIPVIFSAISQTSLNGYVFIQQKDGPCYNCIKPETIDAKQHECADPSVIYTHTALMGIATYATVALLQGWKLHWNYYELILDSDSHTMKRPKRIDCELCKEVN